MFAHIRAGARIFIGTGCGEPQYLVGSLIAYLEKYPKAFFDTEIVHVWTLGVAPYTQEKFRCNFRHNSFFVGRNTREAVNKGMADYTPVSLSAVPDLFRRKMIPIDVALIQTSLPDSHGYLSLGVSVDIVKEAVEHAGTVIVQVNARMPRVNGDTFIHIRDVDFLIPWDEPLLELHNNAPGEVSRQIGGYVAELIGDGDTIQAGYGNIPNAVLESLAGKKHLGIHTELLSDGAVNLIKSGVIDNSRKTACRGRTVASFCMGSRESYDYLHDNPAVEFHPIDYTNNPLRIARIDNMVAINSALEIDLTGQATAESLGHIFYSGIGGQADFMRGAALARGGRSILALPSTNEGGKYSRIVPTLKEGAGVTLTRGDIHYVVTEQGIAYLHGKNIRERALSLAAIAHPDHRPGLVAAAKNRLLICPGGVFPLVKYSMEPETVRTARTGQIIYLRPAEPADRPRLENFYQSLAEQCLDDYLLARQEDAPPELEAQCIISPGYTRKMVLLAEIRGEGADSVVGIGEYCVGDCLTARAALVVSSGYRGAGVGQELLSRLAHVAGKRGITAFTAVVLPHNKPAIRLMERIGFSVERRFDAGVYVYKINFK